MITGPKAKSLAASRCHVGTDAASLPLARRVDAALQIVVLLYREPTLEGHELVYPPHAIAVIDPEAEALLAEEPCSPRSFGLTHAPEEPFHGFGLEISADEYWTRTDAFLALCAPLWEAFRDGAAAPGPPAGEILDHYEHIAKRPLRPYYEALAPELFAWLRAAAPAGAKA